MTLLGLGGLGLLCLTDAGRRALRRALERLRLTQEDWSATTERELNRLQHAVERVADELHVAR